MSIDLSNNLFFINEAADDWQSIKTDSGTNGTSSQALIFTSTIESYNIISAWATGGDIMPATIQDASLNPASVSDSSGGARQVLYLNKLATVDNQWNSVNNDSGPNGTTSQALIFTSTIASYTKLSSWATSFGENADQFKPPTVQDYLASLDSGPLTCADYQNSLAQSWPDGPPMSGGPPCDES